MKGGLGQCSSVGQRWRCRKDNLLGSLRLQLRACVSCSVVLGTRESTREHGTALNSLSMVMILSKKLLLSAMDHAVLRYV